MFQKQRLRALGAVPNLVSADPGLAMFKDAATFSPSPGGEAGVGRAFFLPTIFRGCGEARG
jgi:hypothetical protein